MPTYTKIRSSYILQKKHQNSSKGSIFYRDWVTTGGWDRFIPGKTPYYRDGNFIFTTTNIPDYQKKHKYGEFVGEYTYDDVKNSKVDINEVKLNQSSKDLRDYALYGSCVELVRSTVEKIIREFPAQITVSNTEIQEKIDDQGNTKTVYMLSNPFNIDLHHNNVQIGKYTNLLRYMSYSYESYQINGTDITNYTITLADNYDDIINCPQDHLYETFVRVNVNNTEIRGLYINGVVIFVTDISNAGMVIRPKQEIIDEYFNDLEGFEWQLLNRNTTPLYKNSFLTPIEGVRGRKYVYRDYIWPSVGYQIDISSPSYTSFIRELLATATLLDEYDCDNIYRGLTHEAIKNFDWTYTREYSDGEEEENIEGGTRMQQFLRVFGRYIDDIKRYIDGIKFTNNITYDKNNNQAEALLSDKLDVMGWDVFSTISTVTIQDMVLSEGFLNEPLKWYSGYNVNNITPVNMDNEFMRRLILNSKRIFSTKGTVQAIDMIMGMFGFGRDKGDYKVTEEYKWIKPKPESTIETFRGINLNKDEIRLYDDDDFSGVPLKVIEIKNGGVTSQYVVPYYNHNKTYDGYLYFQSQGGWGSDGTDNTYIYKETFNYLRVVSTIGDLLTINPSDLSVNDIFYVVSINDIMDYDDSITDFSTISHLFYLKDIEEYNSYSGWGNINDADTPSDIREKAIYLENIISTSVGNNPHVGYGNYDNGEEYFAYMQQPFQYVIDNNKLPDAYVRMAESNTFGIEGTQTTDETHKKVEIIQEGDEVNRYYLNSKVLRFTNNINNSLYKTYFKEVILNYLMQVIPSTTILILKGFE